MGVTKAGKRKQVYMDILKTLQEELNIGRSQVEAAVKLIDEGNTIPFIARYRKEATGALNDEVLRNLDERLRYLRNLEEKKEQVLTSIREQEKLTPELERQILEAATLVAVEDLYRPYRPKRRTRATIAQEKGLGPLADVIMLQMAKELNCEKTAVLGYRDQLFLNHEFEPYGKVYVATEDGSAGTRGNVLDAVRENGLLADVILACGPTPMLRAVKEYGMKQKIETFLSMEEKMACGVGACLACVCQTKEVDHHSNVHNRRICKDGPVFRFDQLDELPDEY